MMKNIEVSFFVVCLPMYQMESKQKLDEITRRYTEVSTTVHRNLVKSRKHQVDSFTNLLTMESKAKRNILVRMFVYE